MANCVLTFLQPLSLSLNFFWNVLLPSNLNRANTSAFAVFSMLFSQWNTGFIAFANLFCIIRGIPNSLGVHVIKSFFLSLRLCCGLKIYMSSNAMQPVYPSLLLSTVASGFVLRLSFTVTLLWRNTSVPLPTLHQRNKPLLSHEFVEKLHQQTISASTDVTSVWNCRLYIPFTIHELSTLSSLMFE